jgi:hypothetical protein
MLYSIQKLFTKFSVFICSSMFGHEKKCFQTVCDREPLTQTKKRTPLKQISNRAPLKQISNRAPLNQLNTEIHIISTKLVSVSFISQSYMYLLYLIIQYYRYLLKRVDWRIILCRIHVLTSFQLY